jgi:flagellar biosynthesis protein
MVDFYDKDAPTPSNISKIKPAGVAVAISDSKAKDDLPRVTAAGRGKIAEQIVQLAFEHGIKVREDSALAAMLATIELDTPIPSEAFMAVAEILSYVYRANGHPDPFNAVMNDDPTN